MLGLAMMMAAKKTLGMRTFVEGHVMDRLAFFFKNIDESGVERLESLCDVQNWPWESYVHKTPLLRREKFRKGHALEVSTEVRIE